MKTINFFASIAVLTAACVALPAASAADSPLARVLLAQSEKPRPLCKDDEKSVPRGSTVCREGKVHLCNPYGQWENTGKPC
jgi:hypothetical protein